MPTSNESYSKRNNSTKPRGDILYVICFSCPKIACLLWSCPQSFNWWTLEWTILFVLKYNLLSTNELELPKKAVVKILIVIQFNVSFIKTWSFCPEIDLQWKFHKMKAASQVSRFHTCWQSEAEISRRSRFVIVKMCGHLKLKWAIFENFCRMKEGYECFQHFSFLHSSMKSDGNSELKFLFRL